MALGIVAFVLGFVLLVACFMAFNHLVMLKHNVLGVLLAFGVWYAVGKVAAVAIDAGPAPSGYFSLLSYAVFGTAGFFGYLITLNFASSPRAKRGMFAGGVLLILFAACFPFARDLRLKQVPEIAVDAVPASSGSTRCARG